MIRPKIAMILPCWGRSDIFSLVCRQLDVFYEETKNDIDLIVFYVFSEEDKEIRLLLNIYHRCKHRRSRIYSSNKQLGQKLNDGIAYAKAFGYDYIMNMGSDDLIHPGIITRYLPFIKNQVPIIGIGSLYFLKKNEDPIFFFYYNTPHVIGAGRLIHRSAVERVTFLMGSLYEPTVCRGMDGHSARRLRECGYNQQSVYRGEFPYIVDIKSEVNINSFEHVTKPENRDRYRKAKMEVLEKEYEILKTYK
jgi:hypothetical protein